MRIFNPAGLPLPDSASVDHPKVKELRDLSAWSEGQVWCSPERHGSMTGIMKAQIDWLPLSLGGTADAGADIGRHAGLRAARRASTRSTMRMVTIPNQSLVAKAFDEFDAEGRMNRRPTTTESST